MGSYDALIAQLNREIAIRQNAIKRLQELNETKPARLSVEGREKISNAAKLRWEKYRKSKNKAVARSIRPSHTI